MAPKKRNRPLTLRRVLLIDLILLILIGIGLLRVQIHITEQKEKENLTARLNKISSALSRSYEETQAVTELYDSDFKAKVQSIAYVLERYPDAVIDSKIKDFCRADALVVGNPVTPPENDTARYYSATVPDGPTVTIRKENTELDEILSSVYTENSVLKQISSSGDLFFLVTDKDGTILYFPVEEWVGKTIHDVGLSPDYLTTGDAKWMVLRKQRYYVSSIENEPLGITITCGIGYRDMTMGSHTSVALIFIVLSIVFTVILTYSYFCKQEEKRSSATLYAPENVNRKLGVIAVVGMIAVGLTTYYVQTLVPLSLFGMQEADEEAQLLANLEESQHSFETLQRLYNDTYLNRARMAAYILSQEPELRTKETLKDLSDMFDLEYIMLFDKNGNETLSDSPIINFRISDNPEDQSYPFRQLKNGVPYYIQEITKSELTGEPAQFIGVTMTDETGTADGFLQICISADILTSYLENASLKQVLTNAASGSQSEIVAVYSDSDRFMYSSIPGLEGKLASDYGMTENQLRGAYFGTLTLNGERYYGNSFEVGEQYVYIMQNYRLLFVGRQLTTIFAIVISFLYLIFFGIYLYNHEVEPEEKLLINGSYVNVETDTGTSKRTPSIVTRMEHRITAWNQKTPEEKTEAILTIVLGIIGFAIAVAFLTRNSRPANHSIFRFIINGKWDRGLNVFAVSEVILFVILYFFVINIIEILLNEAIRLVNPRSETMLRLIRSLLNYVGVITLLYVSLITIGFDARSLLASAGLLTLVIGLGAKDLITDVLAGIFIIFEREFQVGDIIEVNGFRGRVLEIGIRTTKIENVRQDIKSVNNRELTNIINTTRHNSYCIVTLYASYENDIDDMEAMFAKELPNIAKKYPDLILDGPTFSGVTEMTPQGMKLSFSAECIESKKFKVSTILNRELKSLFEDYGFKFVQLPPIAAALKDHQ